MNKEASLAFLKFANRADSSWSGNFRDLNAAITRMATLAPNGRIRLSEVEEETVRLKQNWHRPEKLGKQSDLNDHFDREEIDEIDPFDRPQLAYVIHVCKESTSLSDAGRKLFAVSREKRKSTNDGDRLRKYLAKFGRKFEDFS